MLEHRIVKLDVLNEKNHNGLKSKKKKKHVK